MASLDEEEDVTPQEDHVKLVSKDDAEFLVPRACCMFSGTIRAILNNPGRWRENQDAIPTIKFDEMSTDVLEKVIEYLEFKLKWDSAPPPIPKFHVEVNMIVPLLLASNYLDA